MKLKEVLDHTVNFRHQVRQFALNTQLPNTGRTMILAIFLAMVLMCLTFYLGITNTGKLFMLKCISLQLFAFKSFTKLKMNLINLGEKCNS